jgi:ssDNA-binding replication factor A large subunit
MYYQVQDLTSNMKRVNIIVKLCSRSEPRYAKGYKITTFIGGDPTGRIMIPFWNSDAEAIQVGDYLEIENGYVSEFREKLQLNIGKFGTFRRIDPPETFEVDQGTPLLTKAAESDSEDYVPVEALEQQTKNLRLRVVVKEKVNQRTVQTRQDGHTHQVATFLVGDGTGCIHLDLWDEKIAQIEVGTSITIQQGYVRVYRGQRTLNLAQSGRITPYEGSIRINLNNNMSEKPQIGFNA